MHYIIRRVATGKWTLTRSNTVIATYPTRAAAHLVGRMLAGHAGTVITARK